MTQAGPHTNDAANDPVLPHRGSHQVFEPRGAAKKEVSQVQGKTLDKYARAGLWLLPVYGVANFVGTLSSQPDYHKAGLFPAYARYISTGPFLASHLVLSIMGTGIGLIGFTALFIYLGRQRTSGVSVAAFVTTVLGNMPAVAMFGVAAFAQSAIGKAFLAGHHDVIALNSSVYGTAANLNAAVGILLLTAGMILFGVAISRSQSLPRTAGILLAGSLPIFAVGSITGTMLASVGALMLIASTIWIARSASRTPRSTAVSVDQTALGALDA